MLEAHAKVSEFRADRISGLQEAPVNAVRPWQMANDPNNMAAAFRRDPPRPLRYHLADSRMKASGVRLIQPLRPTFQPARKPVAAGVIS